MGLSDGTKRRASFSFTVNMVKTHVDIIRNIISVLNGKSDGSFAVV